MIIKTVSNTYLSIWNYLVKGNIMIGLKQLSYDIW